MLVQITNKCFGGCEHCMQVSYPGGGHMDFETFKKAVKLALDSEAGMLLISGGEPTDHPDFLKFVRYANERIPFIVCTNGYWVFDDRKKWIEEVSLMENCFGIQVYSNPKFYKRHWEIYKNRKVFESIRNCIPSFEPIGNMQLLGRAKNSEKAFAEARKSPHFFSCLNSTIVARQVNGFRDFNRELTSRVYFCKPLIDFSGNIHMSESCKCQSIGSVNEPMNLLFARMKSYVPCGKCYGYEKFMKSKREDVARSKAILYGISYANAEK